jgi:hypothetical protein
MMLRQYIFCLTQEILFQFEPVFRLIIMVEGDSGTHDTQFLDLHVHQLNIQTVRVPDTHSHDAARV